MIDEIWAFRKYDYFGFQARPGDVVVDVGGNIGTFAVYAATACRAGRVISFEPHPQNFAMLRRNVESNGLDRVTCVNKAVAGHRGTARLDVCPENSGGHALGTGGDGAIEVECCTLEDVFTDLGLDRIDYLKIDCEGAEYDIFASTPRALFDRIGRISMKYHVVGENGPDELRRTLSDHGFDVIEHGGHRLYAGRP